MDRSSSLTALALVLWAACLACNCERISSSSYLNFPTDFGTDFHKNIASALNKIAIKGPSMEWFAGAIEKAKEETYNEIDKQVYSDLIELREGKFEGRLKETFLSICAQADHVPNSGLKPWKNYLTYIGRDRFSFSLREIYNSKEYIRLEDVGIKMELDEVFAAAFNMKGDLRNKKVELAQKLSRFDLTKDRSFNAKNMIGAIKKITNDKSIEEDYGLFKNYMLKRCGRLMTNANLNRLISRMDLLRYLDHQEPAEPFQQTPLKILDEYHRLCLALRNTETSVSIEANFNKQLKSKRFWLFKR